MSELNVKVGLIGKLVKSITSPPASARSAV